MITGSIVGGSGSSGNGIKGIINVPSDFPTPSKVKNLYTYLIGQNVVDNDPTRTNTGQSFTKGQIIVWDSGTSSWVASTDGADIQTLWGYQDFPAGTITGTSVTLTSNQNGTDAEFNPTNFYNYAEIYKADGTDWVYTAGFAGLFQGLVDVVSESGVSITLNKIPNPATNCRIWWLYQGFRPISGYIIPPENILNSASTIKLNELFQTKVNSPTNNNILTTDASGQSKDSGKSFSDTDTPTTNQIWSGSKSKSYADSKVEDAINDGVTDKAPSENAVFDALALKQNLISTPTNNNIVTTNINGQTQDSGKSFSTDGTFAGDSDNLIPTQKAVKTYADNVSSNASVISKVLTGFVAGAGTVSASDSILSAFQKIVGNIAALVTGVASVFGRTGNVVAQNGDYTASQITNVPAGNIAATQVQAAINELDIEKADKSITITATSPITGGGDLSQNRTLGIQDASTTQKGATQLSNSYSGTSQTLATTEKALNDGLATKEPVIANGTIYQYLRGDKTWQTLDTSAVPENGNLYFTTARVLVTALTGLTAAASYSVLAATDTILQAFGKIKKLLDTTNSFDRWVDAVVGSDSFTTNSKLIPFATINKALTSAQFPLKIHLLGQSFTENLTLTSGQSNITIGSEFTASGGVQTELNGTIATSSSFTRLRLMNLTLNSGSSIPITLASGDLGRHVFENVIIQTTNSSLMSIPTNFQNWIDLIGVDISGSAASILSLPTLVGTTATLNIKKLKGVLNISAAANSGWTIYVDSDCVLNWVGGYNNTPVFYTGQPKIDVISVITTQASLTSLLASASGIGLYAINFTSPTGLTGLAQGDIIYHAGANSNAIFYPFALAPSAINVVSVGSYTKGQTTWQIAGSSVWGAITGTLSSQTDLQNALNAKQNSLAITPSTSNAHQVVRIKPDGTGYETANNIITYTTSGRDALSNVPLNLVIYNSDSQVFEKYNGTGWDSVGLGFTNFYAGDFLSTNFANGVLTITSSTHGLGATKDLNVKVLNSSNVDVTSGVLLTLNENGNITVEVAQGLEFNGRILITKISTTPYTNTLPDASVTQAKLVSYVNDSLLPVGSVTAIVGFSAPNANFMLADGSLLLRASYPALWALLNQTKGAVTVTIASPGVFTNTNHGLFDGARVFLTTSGTLPTGLTANLSYFVKRIDANSFYLSTSYNNLQSGVYINTSGTQSGAHVLNFAPFGVTNSTNFRLPDLRGLALAGAGTANTVLSISSRSIGTNFGQESVTLTSAQSGLPAHSHPITDPGHFHSYDRKDTAAQSNIASGGTLDAENDNTGYTVTSTNTKTTGITVNNNTAADAAAAHNNMQPTLFVNYYIKVS